MLLNCAWIGREFKTRTRRNMRLPQKNSTRQVETEYTNHLS